MEARVPAFCLLRRKAILRQPLERRLLASPATKTLSPRLLQPHLSRVIPCSLTSGRVGDRPLLAGALNQQQLPHLQEETMAASWSSKSPALLELAMTSDPHRRTPPHDGSGRN